MSLRQNMRSLELLENKAAERAGLRFQLLDEARLLGPDTKVYAAAYALDLLKTVISQGLESASLGGQLADDLGLARRKWTGPAGRNQNLSLFTARVGMLLTQWAERMKIYVIENRAFGLNAAAIRRQRRDPLSKWALEREALNRTLKKEAAGLINRLHQAAYIGRLG